MPPEPAERTRPLRRRTVLGMAGASMVAGTAFAQSDFPNRTITVITPYAPGGAGDQTMRILASYLSKELGQQVLVDNKPGAATALGLSLAAKSPPDGYTLAYAPQSMVINPQLYKNHPYDPFRDFAPIGRTALLKYILIVNPSMPFRDTQELLAYARANPGKLSFGSSGIGGGTHLSGELLMKMTGVKLLHVPYKGAGPALVDVIGGRISMMFDVLSTAIPQIKAGKVRAIGVTAEQRSPLLPDVPTMAETIPKYSTDFWIGLAAPRGTPADRIETLSRAVNRVLNTQELKDRLIGLGLEAAKPNTPQEFAAFMKSEWDLWGDLIRHNKIEGE